MKNYALIMMSLCLAFSPPVARAQALDISMPLSSTKENPSLSAEFSSSDKEQYILTLPSAIIYALNEDPDIDIAQERIMQEEQGVEQAWAAYYPQLEANVLGGYEYNDPSPTGSAAGIKNDSADIAVRASQLVYDGQSTINEIKRRKSLRQSAMISENISVNEAMIGTISAYIDILRFQKNVEEARFSYSRLHDIHRRVRERFEAGAEDQARLSYVEARLAFAKSEVENITASLENAKTELEYYTGDLPEYLVETPDSIDISPIEMQTFLEQALENNTDLLLALSDRESLHFAQEREKGTKYPTISILSEYGRANGVGGNQKPIENASIQLQLSYKIFDGGGRKATHNIAKSQYREMEHRLEKIKKNIRHEIKMAYTNIIALESDIQIIEEEIRANKELQILAEQQFLYGEGDLIRLIEGEERLYTAKKNHIRAQADLLNTTFETIEQAGMLSKELFCISC